MTAVCLKAKRFDKTEAWSSVFNSFNTDAESCIFIKQLTTTCISTIIYLRQILSDDFFEAKSFEGMTLKLLKSTGSNNYAFKIHQWLEGAFDAIEKKYLKRLMFDVKDGESNRILEVYTMSFNYYNKKESNSLLMTTIPNKDSECSMSSTKLNTIKLLQMCYAVTQTYRSLPLKVTLGMRLSYYENAPDDYQPSGYMACEQEDPEFSNQARSIEIGITDTQYHFFKLFNKSCLSDKFFKEMEDQLENSSSTVPLEGDDLSQKENISQVTHTRVKRQLYFHSINKNLKTHLPAVPKPEPGFLVTEKDASLLSKRHKERTKLLQDTKNQGVRCPCLFSKKSESMFSCSSCRFLVHAECFGILEFDSSKKIHFFCHLCHQKGNSYKCHDKVIVSLKNPSDQQKLSVLRRVLRHCNMPHVKTVTLKKMEKLIGSDCQDNVINLVLNKMIETGIMKNQGKKKGLVINKNELTNKLSKFFYKVQNSDQTKQQILPYSLRSCNSLNRKKATDEICGNKKSKELPAALKDAHTHNNQTESQQSYDIFC